MRYSQLFGKTLRKTPQEAEAISHKFLLKGGFIDRALASGIYTFLPLGWRVHEKIKKIIQKEISAVGGQEIFMPVLHPKNLWVESNRWDTYVPRLFKLKDRHDKDYCLAPTHEEVISDLCRRFVKSYRDLPMAVYQIQNKFRNEVRSTGGLLRVREFVMKDLYSFHATEESLDGFYWQVYEAYKKIFARCGLMAVPVEAESGSIGGSFCHEFMTIAETGEDQVVLCSKCDWAANFEVAKGAKKCRKCGGKVKVVKAIESGHVFKLGTVYSEKMGVSFVDKDGKEKLVVMGCYGIGLGRLMATIVEASHDKGGIIWPESVAPYQVHLIGINLEDKKVKEAAEELYQDLVAAGTEVLYDDREEVTAGVKFNDADLIGIPLRLVVSGETLKKESVELKKRNKKKTKLINLKEILSQIYPGRPQRVVCQDL